ncbi:MAG: tRNA pseudouridine(38-40) synthase TruA [Thomasclavelia sp.]|jgi:tRNA pseudouridine38-40 synthase|nr:tRNA pseudouridine(38-40) synthase TruA [Thomasclavelia sp.]
MRIKCICSYDGTNFHGWQVQKEFRTTQGEIQKALKNITGENIIIHGSGRTDRKVHALNQVFHFDTSKNLPIEQWKRAINHFLPNDIYIKSCEEVSDEFHSRYCATKKEYRYFLNTKEYNPLDTNHIFQFGRKLDIDSMKDAAKIFIGEYDFASYCAHDEYGNTIRNIYSIDIEEENGVIIFSLVGNGFRRYMVRHIVGALIQVGQKRKTKEYLKQLLDSKGKEKCLFKAKPQGLYLYEVSYEED